MAQWHLTTRYVSDSGFTEILSLHFRSKRIKINPSVLRTSGNILIFERKCQDKMSVNPPKLTYLVIKCHIARKLNLNVGEARMHLKENRTLIHALKNAPLLLHCSLRSVTDDKLTSYDF